MLEKAKRMIESIDRNEYLTAAEAWFAAELMDLMRRVDDEFGYED